MSTPTGTASPGRPGLAAALALYTLARLALVGVIAGVLLLAGAPLVVSVLVALVVALPLSMLVFRGLRARLDEALAEARTRRGAERAALRARLRGDVEGSPAGSGDRPERQADGRRD